MSVFSQMQEDADRIDDLIAGYSAVVNVLPIAAFISDVSGAPLYLSIGWERLTGQPASASVRDAYVDLVHPDDAALRTAQWTDAAAAAETYRSEYRLRFGDGTFRYVASQADPVLDGSRVIAWCGTLADIDGRYKAEAATREAYRLADERARFSERLIDASDDCIKTLDLNACLLSMSQNGLVSLGIDDYATVHGRNWLEFWVDADRAAAESAVDAARQGGRGNFVGVYAVRGDKRWWDVTVTPILDENDRPESLLVVSRNVTERFLANRALIEAETRHTLLGEALPIVTWTATPAGRLDYSSHAPAGDVPADVTDAELANWLFAVHPDDLPNVMSAWDHSVKTGSAFEYEVRMRTPEGNYAWHLARAALQHDESGVVLRWVGVAIDIDTQHRAYERERKIAVALQESSLPHTLPTVPGLKLSVDYRPGNSEATIGGDWYDAFALRDGRIVMTIGDVLGKGLSAAVTMSKVRQAMRAIASVVPDPNAMLLAADSAVRDTSNDAYATAVAGIYDPTEQTLTFASAGHPGPSVRRPDGTILEFSSPGTMLGIRPAHENDTAVIPTPPGTTIAFYTDGLTEVTRDIDEGFARLHAALADETIVDSENPAFALVERVLQGNAENDDVAVLIAKIL